MIKNKSSNYIQSINKAVNSQNHIQNKKSNIQNNNSNKINKNKIKILNKNNINFLEIKKKIRKSPVPKVNKLSPVSKTNIFSKSNNENKIINKTKKIEEFNSKTENIFKNRIIFEENKKKINLAIKRTSPGSIKFTNNKNLNNSSNNKKIKFLNKNLGDLVENSNIKLKISKKTINNCLNDFKSHINDYYTENNFLPNDKIDNKNNNKNLSFLYNRKRNYSFGYNNINNSSNCQSKDSNKNNHISLNKTIQSDERKKIINKKNKSKLNSFSYINCINLIKNNNNSNDSNTNKNNININSNINNNKINITKLYDNQNHMINKKTKKLTIIQNFSKYKKKSLIMTELNDYVNDENNSEENNIKI